MHIDDPVAYWNGPAAARWTLHQDALDTAIRPFGRTAMDRAAMKSGEHVLDVGCGCGDTSMELARAVGPSGSVVGVDVSAPMLARARERGAAAGLANLRFVEADASTHAFERDTDLVFSRFGVMFFAEPEAAFGNIARALRPDGRLTFVCWRAATENPWMYVPVRAAAALVPPTPPAAPDAPGPFAFADGARVKRALSAFRDVDIEPWDTEQILGADLDTATRFAIETGPTARIVLDADERTRAKIVDAVRTALAPYETPRGVALRAATWIVTARV